MTNTSESFYLADWYVDTASNRLIRDEHVVKLESKVMAVLSCLARQSGEVVSREALERAVWGKTIVGYDALTGAIARLRRELGDDPRQPRYIETISKKGYRLIGQVSHDATPSVTSVMQATRSPGSRRYLVSGLAAMAVVSLLVILHMVFTEQRDRFLADAERPSIVVMPFTNLSDAPDSSYFTDGMTADITTELSRLSGLFVISHASASGWQDKPMNLREVANSLGVQYVLEGNARLIDNRLRVNVHLIDARRDVYLWSEKYDRQMQGVFDMQDDITANIVSALAVKLTEEEKNRVARRYTSSIAAYDDFLRGLAHYSQYTPEENRLARDDYRQAIARDEVFARAYSAMALTYVAEHRYGWAESPASELDEALRLAQHAIALDETLPQAYWVLAYVQVFRQAYTKASAAARRAIALDPNYADSYVTLAVCKMHFGEAQAARELVRKAMLLNPRYPAAYASVLGQIHYYLGEYEVATLRLREAIDRNINLITPHVFLIAALDKLKRQDEVAWAVGQLKTLATDFDSNQLEGMLPIQDPNVLAEMHQQLQRAGL